MNWDEIKEIEKSKIGFIGHHSHTHEYLIDMDYKDFVNDIETASKIFKKRIRIYSSDFLISFWRIFTRNEKIYIRKI